MIYTKQRQASSPDREVLRQVFLQRVHELLMLGYQRMEFTKFLTATEPVITGELAKEMNIALECLQEEWSCFFHVQEERYVNDGERLGYSRRRIDIHVLSGEHRPRLQFSFEAKRLHNTASVGVYLGEEGLGNLLEGHKAAAEPDAGMLGCVQVGEPAEWAARLEARLQAPGNPHCVLEEGRWRPHRFARGPAHCYYTAHRRKERGPIGIYHTLLVFH